MSVAELQEYDFQAANTVEEACSALARCTKEGLPAWPIAGCTDWMVERHTSTIPELPARGVAIDITRIGELRAIRDDGTTLSLGAAATFLEIRRNAQVAQRCPLLAQMASSVGALQIQARGTLGGNLASGSPAADGVVALFALDADVVLASTAGERRVPITSYYTGYRKSQRRPEELIVRFECKLPASGSLQQWRKVGTRSAQAISKASLAMIAERDPSGLVTRVGLGAGSVAPTVRALPSVRSLLLGSKPQEVGQEAVNKAVDTDIAPIDDLRSTARYRSHVVRTLVWRFVEELVAK